MALNVHGVVFDELHAQPNRDLYDVMLHGSGDARKQPLFFLITTAGTDRNSICWEVHQKAEDILQGRKIDPTFYPVIYSAADTDDWTSEKVWRKVNPSLGITVDIEKLRVACENAKQNPAEENLFRQLRLNQWVKQSVRWMPMDKWDKCAFPVDAEKLRAEPVTEDLTCHLLPILPPLCWCFHRLMNLINIRFYLFSGYRRRILISVCGEIMCLMMSGRGKAFYIPPRVTWCITVLSRHLLRNSV
jgi:hypothetical protein